MLAQKKVGISLAAEVFEFAADAPSHAAALEPEDKPRKLKMKLGGARLLDRPPSGGVSGTETDDYSSLGSGEDALDAVRTALSGVASASVASGWWNKTRKGKGGRFLGDSKVTQTIMSTVAVGKFLRKQRSKVCDPALTEACASGLIGEVCRLMDVTNPAYPDKTGEYALSAALRNGQWGVVELLLECQTLDVNAPDAQKVPPVLLCIMHSHKNNAHGSSAKCLEQLVNRGAQIDVLDSDGAGLVELALLFRETTIASFLIAECIRRRKVGEGGGGKVESTLLFVVSELEEAQAETCFRRLLEYGVDVNFTDDNHSATPLAHLLSQGKTLLASILLQAGADPNMSGSSSRGAETWALAVRVKEARSRAQILVALVEHQLAVDTPFVHQDGKETEWVLPITYAIKTENLSLFQALLTAGADVNACLVDRASALWTVGSGSSKLLQLKQHAHFLPPICLAMQRESDGIWAQLLQSASVDLNLEWRYHPSLHPPHFLSRPPSLAPLPYVCGIGSLHRLEQLLQRLPPEAVAQHGAVALAEAARSDHDECCRRLLEEEAFKIAKGAEMVVAGVRLACEHGARRALSVILSAVAKATGPIKPLPAAASHTTPALPADSSDDGHITRKTKLQMMSPIGPPLAHTVSVDGPPGEDEHDDFDRLASSSSLVVAALVQDRECVLAAAKNGHSLVVRSLIRALPTPCASVAMEVWSEALLAAVEAEEWDTVKEVVDAQGSVLRHDADTRTEHLAAFMTKCAHWQKHMAVAGLDRMRNPTKQSYEWDSRKQRVLQAMLDPRRGQTVDVDHATHEGNTVLHQAVARGWAGVVDSLLRAGARGDVQDEDGNTCVALAAIHEEAELLLRLVQHFRVLHVKLVEQDSLGHALHDDLLSRCIKQGWLDIAQHLIVHLELDFEEQRRRARGDFKRSSSSSLLQTPPSPAPGQQRVSFGARRRGSVLALEEAYEGAQQESLEALVRRSLEPAPEKGDGADHGAIVLAVHRAMREAAARGWEEGLSRLMQLSDGVVVDDNNKTLPTLAMAALNGSAPCVELLLKKDAEGLSLAIIASTIRGEHETLAMLLKGCSLNKFALEQLPHDEQLRAMEAKNVLDLALCLACLRGSIPCVKLLAEARADVNCVLNIDVEVRRWCGQDDLIAAMLPDRHPELTDPQMQQLYSCYLQGTSALTGADTKTRPLLIGASLGFTGLVGALLELGADTGGIVPETEGMCGLSLASMYGHHSTVMILLRFGAFVDAGREDMVHLIQFCRVRDMWRKVLEGLARTERVSGYGTGASSAFDEAFVPPLPALQYDSSGKYVGGAGANNARPLQVTPLLWSLMARTFACSKLLVEAGGGKDLVHTFVGSEAFVQYAASKPQSQARSIQQDLVGECADYKYYGPFQATLEAKKTAGHAVDTKADTRFGEVHGNVAAHRRVQAVAVDVGWHDRALKEVKFLTGMTKSQLEDAYIWQGRPRSGTTFFMVLRHDEFVEGVDLAIGDESILAIRILVQSSRRQARTSPWYGEPVGSGISSLERNITVRPHGRELAGCKIVTGPAVGDVQVVKEVSFWARWRSPHFAMRSLHPEAQREPFKSEWEQDGRGLLGALDPRITDLILPLHDKQVFKRSAADQPSRPASAPPGDLEHSVSAPRLNPGAQVARQVTDAAASPEEPAKPPDAGSQPPSASKRKRRRKRPASAEAPLPGSPLALQARYLDDSSPILRRTRTGPIASPKTPPHSSMQTRALLDLHRNPSKQPFRRAGVSTLFAPIGNSRRRGAGEDRDKSTDDDALSESAASPAPALANAADGLQHSPQAARSGMVRSAAPKSYSTSESLARVWCNTPIHADDPMAADGKIEGAKKLRRPGTIMRGTPQPHTQYVNRPLMPHFSPTRRSLEEDLAPLPGLGGSTLQESSPGVVSALRLEAGEIAARAKDGRSEVCQRMGEMLQRELSPAYKGFRVAPELAKTRPLSLDFLSASLLTGGD